MPRISAGDIQLSYEEKGTSGPPVLLLRCRLRRRPGALARRRRHPHLPGMDPTELHRIVEFLRGAERLKDVTRTAWTSEGRRESVAEHTWRLCLLALLLAPAFPDVDFARLIRICIIHDLGEAIGGDIPAVLQAGPKADEERIDLLRLLEPLPALLRAGIVELWDEYEAAETPEARLAKALDKIETILQHNQGRNPPDFDYAFNLDYGRAHTGGDPLIVALRAIVDEQTARRAAESAE